MRSAPFVVGLLLGFSASFFTGCPMNTCTAASCPLGCCDTTGRCQTSANKTCGRNGAACASCSGFDTCVSGVCMGSNSGAGQATGGGFPGTGGGASGMGYAAFLTNFSNAYCQYAVRCGQFTVSSQADCAALLRPYFALTGGALGGRLGASERGVTAGYSTFNATRAQACLAELSALPCQGQGSPSADCAFVTTPGAAANAACFSAADCTDSTLGCNGGTCMRRCTAGGNLGESCRPDATCTAPFICAGSVCRNRTPIGATCSYDGECGTGAYCSSARVCASLPGIGSSCPNFRCVSEAYCSGSQCLAKKAANAACFSSSECADGLRCTTARVCGPKGVVGDTCTGVDCAPTLYCNANRQCAPRGPAGAPCRNFNDCESTLDCDDVLRTCRAYSSVDGGQPCSSTRSCTDGQCAGKVIVFDGGTNTAGICRDPVVGDRCSSNFSCGRAKYCDRTTSTCRAAGPSTPCDGASNCLMGDYCTSNNLCATKAAAGQVCDSTRSDSCAAMGETCQQTSTPGTSRCQRVPALGEACTRECVFPAACVGGTCVAAGRVGQPCVPSFPFPCIEGECLQTDGGLGGLGSGSSSGLTPGTCVAPRANGSPCQADQGCQSRYCDFQVVGVVGGAGICAAACN
jgi:hypothetical protein